MTTIVNSVQTQKISDPTEPIKTENLTVETPPADPTANMPADFKDDFFKQKQRMKDAEARADAAELRASTYEEKENIAKGNFQTVIDSQKQTIDDLNNKISLGEKKKKLEKFEKTLERRAEDLGFTKPKRIMNFISQKDMELLKMDGDYNINEAGLDIVFSNVKAEWGELFKPKEVVIADGIPKANTTQTTLKTAKQMTSKERMAMAAKLIKS